MANEQGNSSRKRKLGSDIVNSMLRRTFGNDTVNTLTNISQIGPIYAVDTDSFVLNQEYLSENVEEAWSVSNPNGIVPVVVHPELVSGRNSGLKLSDDQKEGIKFLWRCYVTQVGGILAHDMGLGKTRTCITTIATLLEQSNRSRCKSSPAINKAIVIAPKNAVSVWKEEFNLWCPDGICNVIAVITTQKDGWEIIADFERSTLHNVLILSYETFVKYISNFHAGFNKYSDSFNGMVFCDEAHRLKNPNTNNVKALKKFKAAKLWIGITGTPYQNSLNELCSLVEFFNEAFIAFDFKNAFCKPIDGDLRKLKKLTPASQDKLSELRSLIRPVLHYKNNSFNVERHEVILNIALDGHPDYFKQNDDNTLSEFQVQHKMFQLICECLNSTKEISFNEKTSYLQKVCIHPEDAYKALQKHPNIFQQAIKYFVEHYPEIDDTEERGKYTAQLFSTKIRVATQMVQYIRDNRPNEKIIIVSGSTVLLKKIEGFVKIILNMKCVTYDGEKSTSERDSAVNSIENDDEIRVLLLSLKAGGTALTLTRANHLLVLEPDYNPANDRQAFGRIYRPGQNRTAFIYRLICTGTLEEVRVIRQLEKESMGDTFRADDDDVDYKKIALYNDQELLQYFTDTKSNLNAKLDQTQITMSNEDDDDGGNFGLELKNSRKYREAFEVPDKLDILRGEVWESVSYCFHLQKAVDPLTQYLLNDRFEIVDGKVRLQSETDE